MLLLDSKDERRAKGNRKDYCESKTFNRRKSNTILSSFKWSVISTSLMKSSIFGSHSSVAIHIIRSCDLP